MSNTDISSQRENFTNATLVQEEAMVDINDSKRNRWCFCWYASDALATLPERAALVKKAKWPIGSNISVSFLDGDEILHNLVKKYVKGWMGAGRANVRFVFRNDTNDTDIRISFKYKGSWSVIGTTCLKIKNLATPTMNFGWLKESTSEDESRRVILHEFGHALGLIHEHQNPAGEIQWDRDTVIESLSGPPNNWDQETIEKNMFKPFEKSETNYTNLDVESIMTYPIPAEWTLDGFSIELNKDLSETDKIFIKQQYP